jgi:raffinose/stachyose/melibiose transport system substrate-binding protein
MNPSASGRDADHRGAALGASVPLPAPRWRKALSPANLLALVLLVGSIGISLWKVSSIERSQYASDVSVIRIAHWQLELGYRDALQAVIEAYNRLQEERFARGEIPRRVQVEQLPVSEKTYGQLINTHLIAGTAPDIIEMGKAGMISGAYKAQFFLNLSTEIEQANPYNSAQFLPSNLAPELADKLPRMPWRETFVDGLAGGFDRDLQGYYSIPTTFIPWNRYAVNIDMLQEATGSEAMPRTLGEFLKACEQMRALGRKRGSEIFPIAGSSYSVGFYNNYIVPFMAQDQRKLDADHDGKVTMAEALHGLQLKAWSLDQPALRNLVEAIGAIAGFFPHGFLGMDREAAMLMFTQQQSGFFYCGAWDAGTIYRLAKGKFRVGIIVAGLPGAGEAWGPLHGINEASMKADCAFGINKTGDNVEYATDFLRFWTSLEQNQRFNETADWVPCIIGSKLRPHMAAFAPQIEGFANDSAWLFTWGSGGQLSTIFDGKMQAVMTGRADSQQVIDALSQACAHPNYGIPAVIADKVMDAARTGERNAERGIAAQALAQLLKPASAAPKTNYVNLVSGQAQLLNGNAPLASMRCLEHSLRAQGTPDE